MCRMNCRTSRQVKRWAGRGLSVNSQSALRCRNQDRDTPLGLSLAESRWVSGQVMGASIAPLAPSLHQSGPLPGFISSRPGPGPAYAAPVHPCDPSGFSLKAGVGDIAMGRAGKR